MLFTLIRFGFFYLNAEYLKHALRAIKTNVICLYYKNTEVVVD